ncbi:STAS/SEC14 domain-containing protein [Gilvimarinus sp. SDUM040013]|uniref:STAS/SEC14 domain-containing protein n=1 Tax=Gilvimarinus gilvus TaxID=3058038 RepID=A0ABU4RXP0_9GAMM|nr:STAS/SEC14 domain-containing protein [Gilvimarinus sp. SDUM040013]MDO3387253.1 STAS/SEC14 domain-containing protein [Gilvimarinus sp. SDUM040013]MDX6848942.1 STAS/SEC14 domain-containing protein [Gilvimarinus sp. SDUM040013]
MLHVHINTAALIVTLEPEGSLSQADFEAAARIVDPVIDQFGEIKGVLVKTQSFPGWNSFAALVAHLKFVRQHHKDIAQVALVTDSKIAGLVESVAQHFVSAEVKHFGFAKLDEANHWLGLPTA